MTITKKAPPTNGRAKRATATAIGDPTNDAEFVIATSIPYIATVTIQGVCPVLFHRWSCDDIEAKARAAKGSTAKKTDNVESYVYRCPDGTIGLPGSYLIGSIAGKDGAAKYRQDPRSPRKSALDLYKAGVVALTECATLGKSEWDYLDRRRAPVQRNGITRVRPAFLAGWSATFDLEVLLPEYISPAQLLEVLVQAGRLVGVADYRPTFGRYQVTSFQETSAA